MSRRKTKTVRQAKHPGLFSHKRHERSPGVSANRGMLGQQEPSTACRDMRGVQRETLGRARSESVGMPKRGNVGVRDGVLECRSAECWNAVVGARIMKRRATEKASSRKSEAAARPLGIAVNIDAEPSLPLFLPPPPLPFCSYQIVSYPDPILPLNRSCLARPAFCLTTSVPLVSLVSRLAGPRASLVPPISQPWSLLTLLSLVTCLWTVVPSSCLPCISLVLFVSPLVPLGRHCVALVYLPLANCVLLTPIALDYAYCQFARPPLALVPR